MTEKGQNATKVKCKCDESTTNQSIFLKIIHYSLEKASEFFFAGARLQKFTKLYHNRPREA